MLKLTARRVKWLKFVDVEQVPIESRLGDGLGKVAVLRCQEGGEHWLVSFNQRVHVRWWACPGGHNAWAKGKTGLLRAHDHESGLDEALALKEALKEREALAGKTPEEQAA